MKKLLTTMFIAIVAILMLGTVSNATTKSELKDYIISEKKPVLFIFSTSFLYIPFL